MAAGVFTKGGGLVHIALLEANAVAVFEIDGGDEQHDGLGGKGEVKLGPNGLKDSGFQCRKLRYRARPCSALFFRVKLRGKILSRAMAAAKGSAVVCLSGTVRGALRAGVKLCTK